VTDRLRDVAVVGDFVILGLPATTSAPTTPPTTAPAPTTLIALRRASGSEAWRRTLPGAAGHLDTTADRITTVALVADATITTAPYGYRALVAVDLSGNILVTLRLATGN
jgi:hypothetical protein